jgi:hypothetical protein
VPNGHGAQRPAGIVLDVEPAREEVLEIAEVALDRDRGINAPYRQQRECGDGEEVQSAVAGHGVSLENGVPKEMLAPG